MIVDQSSAPDRPKVVRSKSAQRSAIGNGKLLPGVDQRSTWVRRAKELISDYVSDLGGPDNISTAEHSLIRRASMISVELEQLELKFAVADAASPDEIQLYLAASNCLRRLLEFVGLRRRAKTISTPSLDQYLSANEAAE